MAHHTLKSHPEYFEQVWIGEKTFEVRVNDRGYKVGDIVTFREFDLLRPQGEGELKEDREASQYTGRQCSYRISYVFTGDVKLGLVLPNNVCVFGIRPFLMRSPAISERFTARELAIFDILVGAGDPDTKLPGLGGL